MTDVLRPEFSSWLGVPQPSCVAPLQIPPPLLRLQFLSLKQGTGRGMGVAG